MKQQVWRAYSNNLDFCDSSVREKRKGLALPQAWNAGDVSPTGRSRRSDLPAHSTLIIIGRITTPTTSYTPKTTGTYVRSCYEVVKVWHEQRASTDGRRAVHKRMHQLAQQQTYLQHNRNTFNETHSH
jgi:hypothetical protein